MKQIHKKKFNGNTCITAGYPKGIQYWSSAAGGHVFILQMVKK